MPPAPTLLLLWDIFSYFGLPEHLVTDNGTQFTSDEFQKFLRENDILHILTAPGHPATNGLAERYVGEFKDKLGKIGDTGESVQTKLDRFLLTYRATPMHMRSRCFLPCAYRLEVKYCWVLCVSIYNFLVHYKLQIPGTLHVFTFKYGRFLTP